MSFERLVWQALSRHKLRLFASVAAVACLCVLSLPAANGASDGASSGLALLAIVPVVFASCSYGSNERHARARVLFRLGFSHEQLATLLALEGVAIGGLGAALGVLTSVAMRLAHSSQWLDLVSSGLRGATEDLTFTFCAALVVSALAALGPAYKLARTRFEYEDPR